MGTYITPNCLMNSSYLFKMLSTLIFTVFAVTSSLYHVTFADITSDLLPNTQICGLQSTDDHGTEEVAGLGEFAWSALLEYERAGKTRFSCGGTLINNKYVVTAAHCIKGIPAGMELTRVRLGEHTINNAIDCTSEDNTKCSEAPVTIGIDKFVVHEGYTGQHNNFDNDIALIKLNAEVQFSDYIKPICVPTTSKLLSNKYEGSVLTLAGWGTTIDDSEINVKRKIKATGKTSQECNLVYNALRIVINDTQLCALSTHDICRGNGGSSIASQDDGNWYLAGIVSFGPTSCQPDFPIVYTRVNSFAQWIVDNLEA